MNELEILMLDHCTETEAKRFIENGASVYGERELIWMIENEMSDDMGYDDEDRQRMLDMIKTHTPVSDWSVVEYGNETYYISYVL